MVHASKLLGACGVDQTLYKLSDDQTEYQVRDRLSFMRFVGLALHETVPDAKTIWLFREQLTRTGTLIGLFEHFDRLLHDRGYLAMGGQIFDATVIEARRPRLTRGGESHHWRGWHARAGSRRGRDRSTATDAGPSSAAAGSFGDFMEYTHAAYGPAFVVWTTCCGTDAEGKRWAAMSSRQPRPLPARAPASVNLPMPYRELQNLRNRAVHDPAAEITAIDALRYRDIADRIVRMIEEGAARLPPRNVG